MARKTHDLAVKVGEYTDSSGVKKARWQNVGALMEGDDGGKFIMLAKWFNPAGLATQDGRESILVSAFEPRQSSQPQRPAPDLDDNIPF